MKTIVTLFLAFTSITIFAQNKLGFEFDYAEFGYDTTSSYVEIYYSFSQNDLKLVRTDTLNYVEGLLDISISDSTTGKSVLKREWKVVNPVVDTAVNKSLVGVLGFVIPLGIYKLKVTGKDANDPTKIVNLLDELHVKKFIGNKVEISDLQFASKIIQDSPNKNSIFYKNTYEVIPVPSAVFGGKQAALFFYSEIYNLNTLKDKKPIKLERIIYNSSGKVMAKTEVMIGHEVNSRVEVGVFPVNDLPTDSYTLEEVLLDSTSKVGISSSKRFYVYNPEKLIKDTTLANNSNIYNSQFSVMTADELDDLFQKAKYIATQEEINRYSKLKTLQGKRKFMYDFWKSRDTDPSTPKNEYYEEYMKRVRISNQKYGSLNLPGWKSDRGRVYLMYGEPSEIDRYPNESNTKPYEIWHYNNIEGGVIFVFADLTGFSQYTLVNSTKKGEVRDDNWRNRITTTY